MASISVRVIRVNFGIMELKLVHIINNIALIYINLTNFEKTIVCIEN